MMLRNSGTGEFLIYDISNNRVTSASSIGTVGLDWTVVGFGDLVGQPNETDMLLRNSTTGEFYVYGISNNQVTSASSMGTVGLTWSVAGVASIPAAQPASQLEQAIASSLPSATSMAAPSGALPGQPTNLGHVLAPSVQ
jgi:hypothetical protein